MDTAFDSYRSKTKSSNGLYPSVKAMNNMNSSRRQREALLIAEFARKKAERWAVYKKLDAELEAELEIARVKHRSSRRSEVPICPRQDSNINSQRELSVWPKSKLDCRGIGSHASGQSTTHLESKPKFNRIIGHSVANEHATSSMCKVNSETGCAAFAAKTRHNFWLFLVIISS